MGGWLCEKNTLFKLYGVIQIFLTFFREEKYVESPISWGERNGGTIQIYKIFPTENGEKSGEYDIEKDLEYRGCTYGQTPTFSADTGRILFRAKTLEEIAKEAGTHEATIITRSTRLRVREKKHEGFYFFYKPNVGATLRPLSKE